MKRWVPIDTGRYLIFSPWEIYRKDDTVKKPIMKKVKGGMKKPVKVASKAAGKKPVGGSKLEDRLRDKEM